MKRRPEVLGILEEVVLGCCFGFRWCRGDFGANWREERGVYCWKMVESGG